MTNTVENYIHIISLKCNQQDATSSRSIYFYKYERQKYIHVTYLDFSLPHEPRNIAATC